MDYLSFIANSIHTVVAATADNNGLPVTCAIDIMDADENGLYFLTAKGKEFYSRLKNRGYISLTGIKGADTLSRVAVSVQSLFGVRFGSWEQRKFRRCLKKIRI